jgi:hypothetical protein
MLDLAPVEKGLAALQAALQAGAQESQSPPAVVLDTSPLNQSVDALRATVEQTLARSAQRDGASGGAVELLAGRVGESLEALRGDLSRAISEVHTGSMAEKVGSLMHEMEMLHSTLATLKDVAARQRDYVRSVEEMLVARAKDGTVEIQLTQEMLDNQQAFLEQFQKAMAQESEPPAVTDDEKPPDGGK